MQVYKYYGVIKKLGNGYNTYAFVTALYNKSMLLFYRKLWCLNGYLVRTVKIIK